MEKADLSWFLTFDDGSSIGTEGAWRLVTPAGVAVTSEDHGHQFGLPAPVDAGCVAKAALGDKIVERYALDERTGDLALHLGGDTTIEFLTLSSGYEGWRTVHGNQEVICMGGGRLVELGGMDCVG